MTTAFQYKTDDLNDNMIIGKTILDNSYKSTYPWKHMMCQNRAEIRLML